MVSHLWSINLLIFLTSVKLHLWVTSELGEAPFDLGNSLPETAVITNNPEPMGKHYTRFRYTSSLTASPSNAKQHFWQALFQQTSTGWAVTTVTGARGIGHGRGCRVFIFLSVKESRSDSLSLGGPYSACPEKARRVLLFFFLPLRFRRTGGREAPECVHG